MSVVFDKKLREFAHRSPRALIKSSFYFIFKIKCCVKAASQSLTLNVHDHFPKQKVDAIRDHLGLSVRDGAVLFQITSTIMKKRMFAKESSQNVLLASSFSFYSRTSRVSDFSVQLSDSIFLLPWNKSNSIINVSYQAKIVSQQLSMFG